ncbi:hypothetical protein ACN28I_11955 [Archangium gephyra]|uniref:hypothetical protein n=1 Tax=Archangium gephyra TaxID=48 RepID=UPI003B7B06EE
MIPCSAHRLLALLLCLCVPFGALAQEEEENDLQPRLQEIRALFARLQEASKGPAPIDRKNKAARAQWHRLRAWEMTHEMDGRLRKIVVNSRDSGGEVERSFFLKGDSLFFAFYVTTKARQKDEERLYFDAEGRPIQWQHNKDIRARDGHALRWGEQARSDAKVAVALADGKAGSARFEPITCVVGDTEFRVDLPGDYRTTEYSLFPPAGLPVQKNLCMSSPWYAGQTTSCSFTQEGRTLKVTQSFQQTCDDGECDREGSHTKTLSLSPEMGRVEECPVREH